MTNGKTPGRTRTRNGQRPPRSKRGALPIRRRRRGSLEHRGGIEPPFPRWQRGVLGQAGRTMRDESAWEESNFHELVPKTSGRPLPHTQIIIDASAESRTQTKRFKGAPLYAIKLRRQTGETDETRTRISWIDNPVPSPSATVSED